MKMMIRFELKTTVFKFIFGDSDLKENIRIYIYPELDKTTLAYILTNEIGNHIHTTSVPSVIRTDDLTSILSTQ